METISRSLLTFLLNSLWQVFLAAAVAALACRFLRSGPAGHRHAVWVTALAIAVLLPLASVRKGAPTATPRVELSPASVFSTAGRDGATARPASQMPADASRALSPASAFATVTLATTTATVLLGAYFLFVLFRLARLVRAAVRTVQIRRAAHPQAIPELLERVWNRCQGAFGLTGVELVFSAEVSGPVTAGRTIILPQSLLAEPSEDVLTTAVGHEMAHIARGDFACHVLYELLYLPVSFHPAAWLIRGGIERSREIACDELVIRRLMDAGVYARSIVSIAAGMTALPRPGYTLGVFDGDILEERIRRLVERPAANFRRARLLLVTGLSALAIYAVAASGLAVTARAQDDVAGLMKQAQAAYDRGDYQEAVKQAEKAVQLEPSNVNGRLFLAKSLLSVNPRPAPGPADNPLFARARQQFLEVLARDPRNQPAFTGMVSLSLSTRQFAEAHEWALKTIQANPADPVAYYSAGFADWAMVYPDYASARQAAGMKPEDPDPIPDQALRQSIRTAHLAQLEEGLRLLQIVLQLDPDYADAMAYINLLYRIEAGIADSQAQSADLTAKADDWVQKAIAAKRRQAQNPQQASNAGRTGFELSAPPPPPPPPPPTKQ